MGYNGDFWLKPSLKVLTAVRQEPPLNTGKLFTKLPPHVFIDVLSESNDFKLQYCDGKNIEGHFSKYLVTYFVILLFYLFFRHVILVLYLYLSNKNPERIKSLSFYSSLLLACVCKWQLRFSTQQSFIPIIVEEDALC